MSTAPFIPRHRVDALIDAVIAITMTLLVLELRLPEVENGDIFSAVNALQPKIISWVVSFLILALFWIGQIKAFRGLELIDQTLFRIVVLWLLLTSVIPFTSSMIGEHNEFWQSHVVYAANLIAVQVLVIWRNSHLARHPELFSKETTEAAELGWASPVSVSLCAIASVGVATISPDYASLAYLLTIPFGWILHRLKVA